MTAVALDSAVVGSLHLAAFHQDNVAITAERPLPGRILGHDSVADVATRNWSHVVAVTQCTGDESKRPKQHCESLPPSWRGPSNCFVGTIAMYSHRWHCPISSESRQVAGRARYRSSWTAKGC